MHTRLMVLTIALAFAVTGIAAAQLTSGGAGRERGVEEQNNSGQNGFVTLSPRGDRTLVRVQLDGEPAGRVEPAHLHRGECPKIDPKPAYGLKPVVHGQSVTLVNAPIDKLTSGNYSVNVHASAQNIGHYVACGYLTPGT